MKKPPEKSKAVRKLCCAVCTRKPSEEGLEREFNSLPAQREACKAYIASQRFEAWVPVCDQYDDGGISGGTLERAGLKQLLQEIGDELVYLVVVYKSNRLSRSVAGFAKLVEVFVRNGVTFVSVTQSSNTTTSMGRLTLDILLSFAQFKREVTAERIRDKVAASRKKGMWMGAVLPYGNRLKNRMLMIDDEAAHVRWIFACFLEIGSCTELAREVGARGIRTPRGNRIDKKYIYRMLSNRLHRRGGPQGRQLSRRARRDHRPRDVGQGSRHTAGKPAQAGRAHPLGYARASEGAAVRSRWRRVLADPHPQRRETVPLLRQPDGAEACTGACPVGRVPAGEIEATVIDQLRTVSRQPEIVARTWKAAQAEIGDITGSDAWAALQQLDPLWDELFPADQARIVALLVERVDLGTDGLNVRLGVDGLGSLAREMLAGAIEAAA